MAHSNPKDETPTCTSVSIVDAESVVLTAALERAVASEFKEISIGDSSVPPSREPSSPVSAVECLREFPSHAASTPTPPLLPNQAPPGGEWEDVPINRQSVPVTISEEQFRDWQDQAVLRRLEYFAELDELEEKEIDRMVMEILSKTAHDIYTESQTEDSTDLAYFNALFKGVTAIRSEGFRATISKVNVIDNKLRGYVSPEFFEFSQLILDFLMFINGVWRTEDPNVVRSCLYSFLRAQGVGSVESVISSFLVSAFVTRSKGERISTQKDQHKISDYIDKGGDMMEYVFDSAFADACKNVIVAGAVLRFCDAQTAFRIYEIFGRRPAGTLFDITRQAVKSLAIIVRAAEDISEGKDDLHTILFAKDRWVMAQQSFATLQFQRTRLRVGLIKENDGLFDRYTWLKTARELREYLTSRLKRTSSAKTAYLTIGTMITHLDEWISDVDASLGADYRITPFAISISGNPGIGKSTLIDTFSKLWCEIRGITFSPEMIYHRPQNTDFFDGLKSQPIGHWSEPGSESAEIAKRECAKSCSELTSVIDCLPMIANQAGVDDKGKHYISFEMVISDTNNKTMNFEKNKFNASAYLRRLIHVTPKVREKYRKDYGDGKTTVPELDYQKVMLDPPAVSTDLWTFDIEKCVAVGVADFTFEAIIFDGFATHDGVEHPSKVEAKDLDIFEALACMRQLMNKHMSSQLDLVAKKRSGALFDTPLAPTRRQHLVSASGSVLPPDPEDRTYDQILHRDIIKAHKPDKYTPQANPSDLSCPDGVPKYFEKLGFVRSGNDFIDPSMYATFVNDDGNSGEPLSGVSQLFDEKEYELSFGVEHVQSQALTGDESNPSKSDPDFYMSLSSRDMYEKRRQNILVFETSLEREIRLTLGSKYDPRSLNPPPRTFWDWLCRQEKVLPFPDTRLTPYLNFQAGKHVFFKDEASTVEIIDIIVANCGAYVCKKKDGSHFVYFNDRVCDVVRNQSFRTDLEVMITKRSGTFYDFIWGGPINTDILATEYQLKAIHRDNSVYSVVPLVFTTSTFRKGAGISVYTGGAKLLCKLFAFTIYWSWSRFFQAQGPLSGASLFLQSFVTVLTFFTPFRFLSVVPLVLASCDLVMRGEWFSKTSVAEYDRKFKELWLQVFDYFDWNIRENLLYKCFFGSYLSVTIGIFATATLGFIGMMKYLKTDSEIVPTQSLNEVPSVDVGYGCSSSLVRRNRAKIADTWGFFDQKPSASKCTGGPAELVSKVMRNVRKMTVFTDTVKSHGYATGLIGDWAVTSAHYFASAGPFRVMFWRATNGRELAEKVEFEMKHSDLTRVGDDIVMFRIHSAQFVNIVSHIYSGKLGSTGEVSIGEAIMNGVYEERTIIAEHDVRTSIPIKSFIRYPPVATSAGSCGLPVVYQKDKGSALCGIHCAGSAQNGYASVFNLDLLHAALKRPDTILQQSLSETYHTSLVSDIIDTETVLEQPHAKSPFCYNTLENIRYLGRWTKTVVSDQKSSLKPSHLANLTVFYELMLRLFGRGPLLLYDKPMMRPTMRDKVYYNPYSINLLKANKDKVFLDVGVLETVVAKLVSHLTNGLRKLGIESLNPLTLESAINGEVDDQFLRRVTASTSAGFGLQGLKSKYLPMLDDPKRTIDPQVFSVINEAMAIYERGDKVGFVYDAALKDEPREKSKCETGKTRVFYVSPLSLLLLQKMFLSPFYMLMVQFSDLFYCGLGTDMHSEGHLHYERLKAFSNLWMEGDYGGFDLQMPFQIGQAAATVVSQVLKHFGYNERAMKIVNGLLSEGLHPIIHMNGDVYSVPALQASGKNSTAEDNTLRNLIMLMYYWYSHRLTRDLDFFEFVMPLLYGDDVLVAIKARVAELFNNITYQAFVKEKFGMDFTSAAKGSILEKFIEPDQASFLKRKWITHSVLPQKVAALEIDSIYRMLLWTSPSKYESVSTQTISTYDSALRESFFHLDEKDYDIFRKFLVDQVENQWGRDTADVAIQRFPLYSDLVEKFTIRTESRRELASELNSELDDIKVSVNAFSSMTYGQVRNTFEYSNFPTYRAAADEHFATVSRVEEITLTTQQLLAADRRESSERIRTEAEVVMSTGEVGDSVVEDKENVTDIGGQMPNYQQIGESVDFARMTSLTPSDWFARPVRIATLSVPLATDISQQLNVWNLLSLDPSVRSKFRNYGLMRAGMEITIEVAASPFHFGRLLVAYLPKVSSNALATTYVGASAANRLNFVKYLSQSRGCRLIDFRENKPLVFRAPYINYQPFCRLYNSGSATNLGSGTAISDISSMGTLFLYTMNQLAASNSSAPTSATVYVYARFVDTTLAAPTASQTVITTESKKEMITGPVEKTASSLSMISEAVSKIPVFRPWALASASVFKGIASFASIYGWSVPRIDNTIDSPHLVVNQPYQNNAVTIGRSSAQKLSFDPLQSLSVDPRIVGVEVDELSIAYIASVNSLLDQFIWSTSSVPMSTILWSTAVIPNVNKPGPIAVSKTTIQPTAVSFVSDCFDFWCGEIEFTFDFVVSALHRGKVMIQFEPNISQYVLITSNFQMNKDYSLIVDLQETQRVSVCVKWMQSRQWLRVPTLLLANRAMPPVSPTSLALYANGFVVVTPFTVLQSPDGSPITCNVFTRSKKLRLNQFDNVNSPNERIVTQSGLEFSDPHTCFELGENVLDIEAQATLNFGEQPVSMRSFLKRYQTLQSLTQVTTANTAYTLRPALYPDISPLIGGTASRPSPLSYLRYAYLGMYGGARHRITIMGSEFTSMARLNVTMNNPSATDSTTVVIATASGNPGGDAKGTLAFVPSTQGGVEVELPIYTNNYFLPSGLGSIGSIKALSANDTNFDPYFSDSSTVTAFSSTTASGTIQFAIEFAASEDFTLFYWMGAPFYSTSDY